MREIIYEIKKAVTHLKLNKSSVEYCLNKHAAIVRYLL